MLARTLTKTYVHSSVHPPPWAVLLLHRAGVGTLPNSASTQGKAHDDSVWAVASAGRGHRLYGAQCCVDFVDELHSAQLQTVPTTPANSLPSHRRHSCDSSTGGRCTVAAIESQLTEFKYSHRSEWLYVNTEHSLSCREVCRRYRTVFRNRPYSRHPSTRRAAGFGSVSHKGLPDSGSIPATTGGNLKTMVA